ncbi:MAG TPA: hypothetical protein VFR37_07065, partial [Longimicrobium sp.]|nr:hypothetical protein [Longimicrobium sp.]
MPSPRLTLSLVAAALTLGGCASTLTPYSVRPFSDEFEQTSGMGMHNNLVGGLGLHGERLALNARQVRRAGGAPQLVLAVEYVDTDWLFIEGGESLVFLADGDRIALEGTGSRSARVVVSGDQVREISVYSITPAQLRQIAEAQEVRV